MKIEENPGRIPAPQNGSVRVPPPPVPVAVATSPKPMPEPLAYDIKQAAAALNTCTKTVRRLIARGLLTPCKGIRKILIPRQQIEEFFKRNCDVPKFSR